MIWKIVKWTTLVMGILICGIIIGLIGNMGIAYYLLEFLNVSI